MQLDLITALAGLAVSMTWTPGPNNMMLAASGAAFGWHRTFPHAMGVAFGFPVMMFCVAMGLGQVFEVLPMLADILAWAGFFAMLWFAWRIATAVAAKGKSKSRPLNFLEATAFQWINPKAWVFAIGVTASYANGPDALQNSVTAAVVFTVSGLGSAPAWTIFGTAIGRILGNGPRLRAFNIVMAVLLAGSALWLLLSGLGSASE